MTACVAADYCGFDPLIDQLTGEIDPFPIDLVPASDSGFEGQFHSGAQVHITGDLAGEGREIPREVPLVTGSPVAAAPTKTARNGE